MISLSSFLVALVGAVPLPDVTEGDVIFIGGTGGWGDIASHFSTTDKRYGHVGVVVQDEDGEIVIVHAQGNPGDAGRVTKTPLNDFTRSADRLGIYRPTGSRAQLKAYTDYIQKSAQDALPFDDAFDLDTSDAVYCTELVWRGLTASYGQDSVPVKTQWAGLSVISLEDLQTSPHLRAVKHIEQRTTP